MNDRYYRNPAASSSNPPLFPSPPPFLQVPERHQGIWTLSPSSEGPSTPSSTRHSEGGSEHPRPSKKRKGENKKPPVSYPPELKKLIDQGFIIWGQHIPGIEPFDPSGALNSPHYSVFLLDGLHSRQVTQGQAFSGRDDEVEAWATRRLATFPRAILSVSHSGGPPPGITRRPATYSGDGTISSGPYQPDLAWPAPPFEYLGQDFMSPFLTPPPAARASPFSTESVTTSISAEEYYQATPPPTSSSYPRTILSGPSTSPATFPGTSHPNHSGAPNYPLAFGYPISVPHSMGTANPYAMQQAPAAQVDVNYDFLFDDALAQPVYEEQGHYQAASNTQDSSSALPMFYAVAGNQTSYDSSNMWAYS